MARTFPRTARRPGPVDRPETDTLTLIVVCLGLGVLILVLSGLVGALDVVAFGAILGVWALCVTAWLIMGRPGVDWNVPTLGRIVDAVWRADDGRRPAPDRATSPGYPPRPRPRNPDAVPGQVGHPDATNQVEADRK